MKELLNEVARLQKLAGIMTEAEMRIPQSNRGAKDYMIKYKDLGGGKVNILMPNGVEIVVDKNTMTASNGELTQQGDQVFLKFGNDVEITDILKNLEKDKKKGDRNNISEDEYNDEWTEKTKIVKIVRGEWVGNQGEVIGGKNGELDVKMITMFGNPVKTVSEKDIKVIKVIDPVAHDDDDNYDEGPVTDFGKRNQEKDKGYFGLTEAGAKKKGKKKKNPGLWHNIRAQRAKGEKPAHPNSKEYKDAVKAGKEINKGK